MARAVAPTSRHGGPTPTWYMESMWRDLPWDILENVVAFLPLAAVVRFKTVSKAWNRAISQREFALRHALASPPEEYVLITMRYDAWETTNPVRGWEVLDVQRNRFFTVRNDFLTEYVLQEGIVAASCNTRVEWSERAFLAADGGLFCVTYYSTHKTSALLVCNPLLRAVTRLPELPGWENREQTVVMSTSRLSMEYEVFVINDANHAHHPNIIHMYESKTGTWRTTVASIRTPPPAGEADEEVEWESVSPLIGDEFYKLFVHENVSDCTLVSYHKITGTVSHLNIAFPFCEWDGEWEHGHYIQLVVSSDRLFCVTVALEGVPTASARVEIFEIIIAGSLSKECIRFAEMPSELLKWVLGDTELHMLHDPRDAAEIFFATGCAGSVLFCSVSGRSVAYDLSHKSWRYCPGNGLLDAWRYDQAEEGNVFCGSDYCLSLCAP